ncbi:MAG TPA: diguanylate cyclase [Steroidobacteraceae bacterium]|jgi:diguanylate cyclase (GGDEF)-like protein|nr:diguanylate cyclase [Steroidobacteraceae bacterium]
MTSWSFSRYTVDLGLANSALTAIAQDGDGFIWIGSQSGLMRFDGYRFRTLQHDPRDSSSIPSNFVQSLHADVRGTLWVGTANAGLARYDARSGRFIAYPVGGPNGLRAANVEAIIDDGQDGLWVGTDGGVDHLAIATGKVTHLDTGHSDNLSRDYVLALYAQSDGTLLVGDRGGLTRVHPDTGSYEHLSISDASGSAVPTGVTLFAEDAQQRLWVGTTRRGVALLDARGTVSLPLLTGIAAAALAGQSVRGIVPTPDGRLVLATYGAGLFVLDPATLAVRQISHSDSDQTSLIDDEAYGLLLDRSGLLWVASEQGLSATDPSQRAFQTAVADRSRAERISEGNGLATLVDSQDRLWVGHHSSGVDVFGANGAHLATLQPHAHEAEGNSDHSVYALAETADGTVWVGTRNGLYAVRGDPWRLSAVPFSDATGPNIQRLLADGPDLWVGTRSGLLHYEPRSGHWRSYAAQPAGRLSDSFVLAIARRPDEKLWVGTRKGLNLFDPTAGRALPFAAVAADGTPLERAFVVDLWSEPGGRLWVATIDDGVYVLTEERDAFEVRHLTEEDGLPSMNIDALQPDLAGGAWVSTANGLAVIDTRTLQVRRYQRADGVRFGDYWAHASARTTEGDLVFGGVGGLTVVHPALIAERRFEPQLLVSGVSVGGHALTALPFGKGEAGFAPIAVSPGANSFQVEFAATDYTAPQSLRYAYRLQGYDPDWTVVDASKRTAAYTNLAPGDYLLTVRGTDRAGAYAPGVLRIPVHVGAAWYQTWLFRLFTAAAAAALVAMLIHARTAYLRVVKRRLEALVARRTEELRRSKQQIEMIAYLDAMTGLPNRRLFAERFANFRASAERSRCGFTLLLADLDRFKAINDTLGHAAGDAVLVSTAQRLKAVTREVDVVARLGGDEFAVLLDGTVEPEAIATVCARLLESFERPVDTEGQGVQIGLSLGAAIYPRDGASQSELYKAADTALYEAKHAGRNTWRLYGAAAASIARRA